MTKLNIHQPERIKVAMVVYAIERSLADVIQKSVPEADLEQTGVYREMQMRLGELAALPAQILEETYLGDLIKLCRECLDKIPSSDALKGLLDRISALDIVAIRNIACHPNRKLADYCWHRVAAIALDPAIVRLGLTGVQEAYVAAKEGVLNPPPESWYEFENIFIPNNLPKNSDFKITGLVGRAKELSKLKGWLEGGRWKNLAIVAPGGIGKTALVLELLETFCNGEVPACPFDLILYTTLKQERLTENGIEKLDNGDSINFLREEIESELSRLRVSSSNGYIPDGEPENFSNDRVLICVDNAETVILKGGDVFVDWIDEIPESWTVIVTSRVPVDGFRNEQLSGFSEATSESLAHVYARARGVNGISKLDINKIAKDSSGNPLAIKLMIDMLARGVELRRAVSAAGSRVVEFSYQNFVSSIDDTEVQILEVMFAVGNASRSLVGTVLEMSSDETATYLGGLLQTSIIVREEILGVEQFSLDGNVRELIRVNERHLRNRKVVQQKLREHHKAVRFHRLQQGEHELSLYDFDFISDTCAEDLQSHLVEAIRAIKSGFSSRVSATLKTFQEIRDFYTGVAEYHYHCGRLFSFLGDSDSSIEEFKYACEANPRDPRPYVLKGEQLWRRGTSDSLECALVAFSDVMAISEDRECYLVRRAYYNYFDVMVELRQFSRLIEETEGWREKGAYYTFIGVYNAYGLMLSVSALHRSDPKTSHSVLCSSFNEIAAVYKEDGVTAFLVDKICKIMLELVHLYESNAGALFLEDERFSIGSTFVRIMEDAVKYVEMNTDQQKLLIRALDVGKKLKFEKCYNPYRNKEIVDLVGIGLRSVEQEEALKIGLKLAVVTNAKTSYRGFVFARDWDSDISGLFVKVSAFVSNLGPSWMSIATGDVIAYKEPLEYREGLSAATVIEAYSRKDFEKGGYSQLVEDEYGERSLN